MLLPAKDLGASDATRDAPYCRAAVDLHFSSVCGLGSEARTMRCSLLGLRQSRENKSVKVAVMTPG